MFNIVRLAYFNFNQFVFIYSCDQMLIYLDIGVYGNDWTKGSNYDSKAKDNGDLALEVTKGELGSHFPIISNDMENGDLFIVICNKILHMCELWRWVRQHLVYEGDMIMWSM
jgi:hypothetical protein